MDASVSGLDLPDGIGDIRRPEAHHVRARAEDLSPQLCAHVTSEGRHDLGQLYQDAYELLARR